LKKKQNKVNGAEEKDKLERGREARVMRTSHWAEIIHPMGKD
jgi:hypothetical protein